MERSQGVKRQDCSSSVKCLEKLVGRKTNAEVTIQGRGVGTGRAARWPCCIFSSWFY